MSPHERPLRIRALSCHATYRCAHSGLCCRAGWPIPVEPHVVPALLRAVASGHLTPAPPLQPLRWTAAGPASGTAILGQDSHGACVFHDAARRDGGCRVQRHAGTAPLPVACRQFPRVTRHDARGIDISLSHWCPTALAALAMDTPLHITESPAAFPDAGHLEGLDARDTWPPMLRADCLFDPDAYDTLEALTVDVLANGSGTPWDRLARLACWWEAVRTWRPGPVELATSLADHIRATARISASQRMRGAEGTHAATRRALWHAIRTAIPDDLREQADRRTSAPTAEVDALIEAPEGSRLAGRYLAARFFGSWLAYQGEGIRSSLAGLSMALVALEHGVAGSPIRAPHDRLLDGVRTADLLLLHLAVPEALAAAASRHDAQRPALAAHGPT